ncbi:MAG: zinc ribbon domain-containing protein [Phycisphaerae bacterium]
MPTYQYRCRKCGKTFEKTATFSEHEQQTKPACPKCKSRSVQPFISSFQVITSKKA